MLKAYHQFFLYDKDNRLIKKSRKRKSKSFVKAFSQMLSWNLGGGVNTITDLNGTPRSCSYITAFSSESSGNRQALLGIRLGTSSQAVAITDYKLIAPIENGITAGTLECLNCGGTIASINSGTNIGTFTLERLFRNSSGNTISIQEIGIYSDYHSYGYAGAYYLYYTCTLRDIVSPAFDIANGEYLKATYTFSITA